jgi:hypothetical protein
MLFEYSGNLELTVIEPLIWNAYASRHTVVRGDGEAPRGMHSTFSQDLRYLPARFGVCLRNLERRHHARFPITVKLRLRCPVFLPHERRMGGRATALEVNPMKTCGVELFFRAGRGRRYSEHGTLRPLVGLHGVTMRWSRPKRRSLTLFRKAAASLALMYVFCTVWLHDPPPHNETLPSS